jgi:hypothetical protein
VMTERNFSCPFGLLKKLSSRLDNSAHLLRVVDSHGFTAGFIHRYEYYKDIIVFISLGSASWYPVHRHRYSCSRMLLLKLSIEVSVSIVCMYHGTDSIRNLFGLATSFLRFDIVIGCCTAYFVATRKLRPSVIYKPVSDFAMQRTLDATLRITVVDPWILRGTYS